MPCSKCPRRTTCRRICSTLEKELPSIDDSRINYGHIKSGQLRKLLHHRKAVRTILSFRKHLTNRQREIIDLIYNRALTVEEAAQRLGTSFRIACRWLENAYLKMARVIAESGIPAPKALRNRKNKNGCGVAAQPPLKGEHRAG